MKLIAIFAWQGCSRESDSMLPACIAVPSAGLARVKQMMRRSPGDYADSGMA